MLTLPWQKGNTKPTNQATAMLTYLPLKHWRDTPLFISYIMRIYMQLRKTPGLIGFSMRANPLRKNYWTLSLWEGEEVVGTYIHTAPHATIMHKMHSKMGQTAFVSWKTKNDGTPLRWEDALRRDVQSYH
jgi:hypothetical protein